MTASFVIGSICVPTCLDMYKEEDTLDPWDKEDSETLKSRSWVDKNNICLSHGRVVIIHLKVSASIDFNPSVSKVAISHCLPPRSPEPESHCSSGFLKPTKSKRQSSQLAFRVYVEPNFPLWGQQWIHKCSGRSSLLSFSSPRFQLGLLVSSASWTFLDCHWWIYLKSQLNFICEDSNPVTNSFSQCMPKMPWFAPGVVIIRKWNLFLWKVT